METIRRSSTQRITKALGGAGIIVGLVAFLITTLAYGDTPTPKQSLDEEITVFAGGYIEDDVPAKNSSR